MTPAGTQPRRARSVLRLPFLVPGGLALLAALWGGLVRLGWPLPAPRPGWVTLHGPLMVSGFLGTVIGLERAVALGGRWPYLAPLATGLGALALLLGAPVATGALLITLGAAALAAVFAVIVGRQPALFTITMALGTLAWLVGDALWLAGWPVYRVVLWWAAFLVLTIAGERLELSRLLQLDTTARTTFVAIVVAMLAALALDGALPGAGIRVIGAAMVALAAWLGLYDIARRTVRRSGLTRFIAAALLSGYAWLGASGLLALWWGEVAAGPPYDAMLHALFLGFVFSMIFGHAPMILPAVLGVSVSYRPAFYAHLALLHASLVLRILGDLGPWLPGRRWGGLLNVLAVALFLGNTVHAVLGARRAGPAPVVR
jgi:hypothetical protein